MLARQAKTVKKPVDFALTDTEFSQSRQIFVKVAQTGAIRDSRGLSTVMHTPLTFVEQA